MILPRCPCRQRRRPLEQIVAQRGIDARPLSCHFDLKLLILPCQTARRISPPTGVCRIALSSRLVTTPSIIDIGVNQRASRSRYINGTGSPHACGQLIQTSAPRSGNQLHRETLALRGLMPPCSSRASSNSCCERWRKLCCPGAGRWWRYCLRSSAMVSHSSFRVSVSRYPSSEVSGVRKS